MRLRAIAACLKYGLLPSHFYEDRPHHDLGYFGHLALNFRYGLRWATFRETREDRLFEQLVNSARRGNEA
jgi:hypothetical protein